MLRQLSRRICYAGIAASTLTVACCAGPADGSSDLKAFSPKEFRAFPIRRVETISPNTKRFELALPSKDHEMGLTTASFVLIKGPNDEDGKIVTRPYTPTSTNDDKGVCELVIKAYPNGKVTTYLHSLKEGDVVEVKGPMAKFRYEANSKKRIGMLAGGSGLTPCLQVLKEIVKNPLDRTEVHLVFANNTEDDILLKGQLDAIAAAHPNVHVTYVVAQPSASWKGDRGFVSASVIQRCMPGPSDEHLVLVCGPPPFMDAVSGNKTKDFKQGEVSGLLKAAGYKENMVFKF